MVLREGCEQRCPGCAHRALTALESEAQKERWLQTRLAPWREQLAPIHAVGEDERWNYRGKVCLSTAWVDTDWRFGLVVRKELIAIPRCPVHAETIREGVRLLSQALPPGPVFPMAFYVQSGAQATLVLKTAWFPDLAWLDRKLRGNLARTGLEGLWLHLHPAAGRRLFSRHGWHLIWGNPRSMDSAGFLYGPASFQQLLPVLYKRALDEAEAFLAPMNNDAVVDLYCGSGASMARWVQRGAPTIGVELNGESVACAQRNVPQALVLRGKCTHRIPQLRDWLRAGAAPAGHGALLYVNPPRTGLEPEVLAWVAEEFRPRRVAYLSCSAGTLRRDLDRLTTCGYRVVRIIPYDFFPQTYHVETLALLARMD